MSRTRRTLMVALLLFAGAAGKTMWDVVFSPAQVVVEAPAPRAELPELAPLPRPPAAPKHRKKTGRVVGRAPKVVAPAPAVAAETPPPSIPLPAPPLVAGEPEPAPAEVVAPPEPVVHDEPISFDGNGEAIARAIANAKRAAVRRCFEHELKRDPKLEGRVMIELDLAPQRVDSVRVSDDLERPEFTACVAATMQRLELVGLNEEVSVQIPYVLSALSK